jgi:RHS repeat-associated protein
MRKVFFFLWLTFSFVMGCYAVDEDKYRPEETAESRESLLIDTYGHYSSLVCGCVNAITGDYVDSSVDMVIPGPEPLFFERSYASSSSTSGDLLAGWNHNHGAKISMFVSREKSYFAHYQDRSGSSLIYGDSSSKYKDNPSILKLNLEKCSRGITNCPRLISGKTNVKNSIIKFNTTKRENSAKLITGANSELFFDSFGEVQQDSDYTPTVYRLTSEKKPNGNKLFYQYEKRTRKEITNLVLEGVTAKDASGQITFGSIQWSGGFSDSEPLSIHLTGSDGKNVDYAFTYYKTASLGQKRPFLTSVKRSDGSHESFSYETRYIKPSFGDPTQYLSFLNKKQLPDGRFTQIEYYNEGKNSLSYADPLELSNRLDFRYGRVKRILGPVGVDETPIPIAQFVYYAEIGTKPSGQRETREGRTEVTDAHNHKIIYHYTDEHRLGAIEKCTGVKDHKRYSFLKYNWATENSPDSTQLLSKSFEDENGQKQWIQAYVYDSRGNVIEDSIAGNLTGIATTFNAKEKHKKSYTYSQDGFNLMLSQAEEGIKTYYAYKSNTDLLISKLITDGQDIKERQFYEYDHLGVLIEEIIDDGTTTKKKDLTNVTERHIKRITPTYTAPYGLPENIVESYLDIKTKKEVVVKRTFNTYSKFGYLIRQEIYDNKDTLVYTLSWDYDLRGNKILECNALGETITRRFDANNNLVYEQGPHPDHHKKMTYDFANRLIRIDEFHTGNQQISESYSYNILSNRDRKIDRYGNTTSYVYDDFGRLVKTRSPRVANEKGKIVTPTETTKYSVLNIPVEVIDAKGQCIRMDNTIRGEPCRIYYPDGTVQVKEYYLKGKLKKMVDRDGTVTTYNYDYRNRLTKTQVFSPNGKRLSETSTRYNAFHRISDTDAAGHETRYSYDCAGRLAERIKGDTRRTFEYDNLGRLNKVNDYYGDESGQVKCACREYDLLNRVIEERIEDQQGTILQKVNFRYDVLGNRTHVIEANGSTTQTIYDSRSRIILTIDPMGHQTHTTYNENFIDEHGMRVLQIITVDPLGNQAEVIHDSHERPCHFLRKNSFGQLIAKQQMKYDLVGNIVHTMNTAIVLGETERTLLTTKKYDSLRQVTMMTEAVGTPEQRMTYYFYHKNGKMASIAKPDGNKIFYEYDLLGRLSKTYDSSQTFSYSYSYDANHNLIGTEDQLTHLSNTRRYDANDRLTQEILANDLTIDYAYDRLGRPTELTLPDKTSISYLYDALFLKEIERDSPQQHYKHQYDHFDLCGKLLSSTLPENIGKISYEYDPLGRLKEQKAPNWNQSNIQYDAAGNLISYDLQDASLDTPIPCSFEYDDNFQLISEKGLCPHDYSYDSLYNRTSKDDLQYKHNPLNQILNEGKTKYTYDPNGNILAKILEGNPEESTTYEYDGLDRLIKVSKNNQVTQYTYDALNGRLAKYGTEISQEIKYLYTGQDEIGSIQNNEIKELRILGTGKGAEIGATVAIELDHTLYVPIHDKMGNITALLNAQGTTVQTYHYSAYGETTSSNETIPNPWRFSSKREDPETGLVYFGRRYYDPAIGRWITTDPLGYEAGPNLYAYVKNSPLIHIDLYGLFYGGDEDAKVREQRDIRAERSREHKEKVAEILEDRGAVHMESSLLYEACSFGFQLTGKFIKFIGDHLLPMPLISDGISSVGGMVMGDGFKWNPSYSGPHSAICPMTGSHFVNVEYLYINGILNSKTDAEEGARLVSNALGGVAVSPVWNSTKGFLTDVLGSILLHLGFQTHATRKIAEAIVEALEKVGKNGFVEIVIHSRGGLAFDMAQKLLTPEQKSQLNVTTFGSAKMINPQEFNSAVNFVSTRDSVPFISDPIGCIKGMCQKNSNVVFLQSDGIPFCDHAFASNTYQNALRDYGRNRIRKYGSPVMQ